MNVLRLSIFIRNPLKGFLLWILILLLCSCVSVRPEIGNAQYPSNWPSLKTASTGQCPKIYGLYAELAIEKTQCHAGQHDYNECIYLSYNLFPHHIGYKHVFSGPEWVNHPSYASNSFIEVLQPNNSEIEIIIWYKDHSTQKVVSQQKLSMKEGDFWCDSSGLNIKDTEFFTMVAGTTVGKRLKSFMLDANNDLVMKSSTKMGGYYWLFVGWYNETIWVRWPRIDKENIERLY